MSPRKKAEPLEKMKHAFEVGDRVEVDGQHGVVKRTHGAYHCTVSFGVQDHREFTRYVHIKNMKKSKSKIVTPEDMIARGDAHLVGKGGAAPQ